MHVVRRLSLLLFCATAVLGWASRCLGQFETSAVLGSVLDAHSAVVPRARVVLENQETGVAQTTETDERGAYQFLEVRVGRYKVAVEARGFKRAETQEFRVSAPASVWM